MNKILKYISEKIKPTRTYSENTSTYKPKIVYFIIESVDEGGIKVSHEGKTYTCDFKDFVWKYPNTESWYAVIEHLKSHTYYGRLRSNGTHAIFRRLHKFSKINLYHYHYYDALVHYITDKYVHVDLGYAFEWNFGSCQAKLNKKTNFTKAQRMELKVGDVVKVVNLPTEQRNEKYTNYYVKTKFCYEQQEQYEQLKANRENAWLNAHKLLGTVVYGTVMHNKDPGRRYVNIEDKYLCRILNKGTYSKGKSVKHLKEATLELKAGDTCMVRIDELRHEYKLMYVTLMQESSTEEE